ncbi:MAG: Crp/Fnr family transcriptional regulator [Pseudobutyrivibrio sp.]|nr:Crp/Fnr family transcriptional regulator [Pseudobutyrivibrio sp.]
MEISEFFPIWEDLSEEEKQGLTANSVLKHTGVGRVRNIDEECEGLILVNTGQLRAFVTSMDGKEVTLYRVLPGDVCLFSAACIMKDISFDVIIEAEKETDYWVIPAHQYKYLMENSLSISKYTNELLSSRFSEVMWLLEQIMWQSMDKRIAAFLMEECNLEQNRELTITHEKIAAHLGTAREVVTRMLKYFQGEGLIELKRGAVIILDEVALKALLA